MVRQRVKTDDEYNRLLEINNDTNRKENIVVNDANKHFQQIKSSQNKTENPFENRHSIQEMKRKLYKEKLPEMEELKKDIEASQSSEFTSDISKNDKIIQSRVDLTQQIRSNTNRLYDDLREPRFTPTKKASRVERNSAKISPVIIELEPTEDVYSNLDTIGLHEKTSNNYLENELSKQLADISSGVNYEGGNLDLTADFTKENADFLNKINQAKQVVEHKLYFDNSEDVNKNLMTYDSPKPLYEDQVVESVHVDAQPKSVSSNIEKLVSIEDQLNEQLSSLGYTSSLEQEFKVDEFDPYNQIEGQSLQQIQPDIMEMNDSQVQPDIMEMNDSQVQPDIMEMNGPQVQPDIMEMNGPQVQPDIMEMNDSQMQPDLMSSTDTLKEDAKDTNRKINLQNTLKLALDAGDSDSLSESQLNILETSLLNNELNKTKSRKTSDIILTIILVIMIIVVLFLILRLILTGE